MERSEIRDSRDAGPGLRFAPSGLQRRDLPVGLFRVQCARQNISLPRLVETALLIPSSRPTEGRSAHEAAGATGIRRSPRPLWAEDSSTAQARCAARASTRV